MYHNAVCTTNKDMRKYISVEAVAIRKSSNNIIGCTIIPHAIIYSAVHAVWRIKSTMPFLRTISQDTLCLSSSTWSVSTCVFGCVWLCVTQTRSFLCTLRMLECRKNYGKSSALHRRLYALDRPRQVWRIGFWSRTNVAVFLTTIQTFSEQNNDACVVGKCGNARFKLILSFIILHKTHVFCFFSFASYFIQIFFLQILLFCN